MSAATSLALRAYTVVRLPSLVAQATVLTRLPVTNPVRLGVEKGLGFADLLVGRALHDEELLQRGATSVQEATTVQDAEAAFAADDSTRSTSALLPEIPPPAPAAVENAKENAEPEPVIGEAPTTPAKKAAAKRGIAAVHEASESA